MIVQIIGGSGFFGKSIIDSFISGNLDIFNIDKIQIISRQAKNLKNTNPELTHNKIELINLDITKCNELPYADYIIHAAANTDPSEYKSHKDLISTNITLGVSNFIMLLKKSKFKPKILYVSSGAVYGLQSKNEVYIDESRPFTSIDGMNETKKIYAHSKRIAENELKLFSKNEYDIVIARCFAFIGPYLPLKSNFVIGNLLHNIIYDQIIKINAKHSVVRSYMHSDDLVYWLFKIGTENKGFNIYNIGSDVEYSIHQIGTKIAHIYNLPKKIEKIENNYVDRYVPSIEKAKKKFNLHFNYNLEQSLAYTIKKLKKLIK